MQVLSPVYRGALGIDALNERLRAALNPDGAELLDGEFRVGDKLIQTRNDYETGLMNGQIAIATGSDEDDERLFVEADDGRSVEIPPGAVRWLRPAYAISVHRSQGCEMPVVVIPVHSAYGGMLSRNLLYTAITRAKQACVLVGQREAIAARRAARRRLLGVTLLGGLAERTSPELAGASGACSARSSGAGRRATRPGRPAEQVAGAGDVGLAHLRIVDRQRLEVDLGARAGQLEIRLAISSSDISFGLPMLTGSWMSDSASATMPRIRSST